MVYHGGLKALKPEPLWEVIDGDAGNKPLPPDVRIEDHGALDGLRVLRSNWLLITKLVEASSLRPLVLGGGCHGVGTSSLAHIVASRDRLETLRRAVRGMQQWRALYRIEHIHYDSQLHQCVCHPADVTLEEVHKLPDDAVAIDWMHDTDGGPAPYQFS